MSYQEMRFGTMVINEGTNREPEYRKMFQEHDCTGKTILDLGCWGGYYIIQAAIDGAKSCVGVEINNQAFRIGLKAIESLRLQNVSILNDSFFDFDRSTTFDIVLCLSVLHHFKEEQLNLFLDMIDNWCLERMIFIVTPPKDTSKNIDIEINYRNKKKIRLMPGYFSEYWPSYKVESHKTVTYPNRIVITVFK